MPTLRNKHRVGEPLPIGIDRIDIIDDSYPEGYDKPLWVLNRVASMKQLLKELKTVCDPKVYRAFIRSEGVRRLSSMTFAPVSRNTAITHLRKSMTGAVESRSFVLMYDPVGIIAVSQEGVLCFSLDTRQKRLAESMEPLQFLRKMGKYFDTFFIVSE